MGKVTLYHYTSAEGKVGIQADGYIKKSEKGLKDAFFGSGVYLTSLSPYKHSAEVIALNNYLYATAKKKVQYAIQLDFDEKDVDQVMSGKRDIWIYRDMDLWLDRHNASWITVQ